MATTIQIPPLGESITEATIAQWLKPDGSFVKRDEEIVELETDKVTMPLPAPAEGVLRHGAAKGDTVRVGAAVGSIEEGAAPPAAAAPAAPAGAAAAAPAAPTAAAAAAAAPTEKGGAAAGGGRDDVRATPLARKIAEERGVDLNGITGTGPGGRISEKDVEAALAGRVAKAAAHAAPAAAAAPAGGGASGGRGVRREKMSQLRRRIAQRLVEAQHTAAMLTTFNECDMTRVMELRGRHKDAFEKSHGVKLGFMSFFVRACVAALRKVPSVNAFIVEEGGEPAVEYHDYCDIAVAVGTEKGLVVPVLRGCEGLSFAEIEKGINTLAAKARDGKLTLDDMQGGTFTISNGGVYGSMMSTPILNPPQSGILGMHNIVRRPVENPEKPGSGEVVVRPMMYLALSYDHRIVDGQGAVTFLKHVKECIEDPERLLLGV
ncbi:MAG: 2-oxoglutarate dehydrogenase complex dihydrolipoyllysine-residue succinyltransferase [Planctomycetota bacterium]|nr:2-oxoglutarate dehydrogenase complex dihydrolipoyllysine-residue succinyltransferase [Planctomycetota bacterium]